MITMHTRREAEGLVLRVAERGDGTTRHLFRSAAPLPRGLLVEVAASAQGPVLRVATGPAAGARYVPAGTHAPIQVNGTYTVVDGEIDTVSFSATYVFGARGLVGPELLEIAAADALEVVTVVVALAPSFPKLWEAAAAQRWDAAAERARIERATVVAKVSVAVNEAAVAALTEALGPAAAEAVAERAELVELLAGRVVPEPDQPPTDERGWAVQDAARSVLSARATEAIARQERLSEAEFIACAADAILAATPGISTDDARSAAAAAYNLMHAVYYGTGRFPDRAPNEQRDRP
jgi:hypothetical protein